MALKTGKALPFACAAQIEGFSGAGQADKEEPPFLGKMLLFCHLIEGSTGSQRQQTLFAAGEKDSLELQTFGCMKRGKQHSLGPLVIDDAVLVSAKMFSKRTVLRQTRLSNIGQSSRSIVCSKALTWK